MNIETQKFFESNTKWRDEYNLLREIILSNPSLKEEYKWMHPCYTCEGKNIVLIHGFKEYCAILFIKGALLRDTKKVLIQQTENVQSGRQLRFTNQSNIRKQQALIKSYINEAIAIEKSGLKIEKKKTEDYQIPAELLNAFQKDPALENAFNALTPGRRRAYLLFISQAKQSDTRISRIEKSTPNIMNGIGIADKFKK